MIKGIGNNSTFISTISSKKDNNNNTKTEDIEKSKVDKIKESIQNGTYKIEIGKTASKMAQSLL